VFLVTASAHQNPESDKSESIINAGVSTTEVKNLQKSDVELPSELPVQLKVKKMSFDLHLKIPLPCRFCSDV
jgi:hypothetical protein